MTEGYDVETVTEAMPAIASWLEYRRVMLRTPGIQVAVRVGDQLISSQAIGYADEPAGEPLRTDHLFRIASHSKTFTATSIMQLVERSAIRLDDVITTWVPELAPSPIGQVTIRELLGHQAGVIRDGVDTDFWQLMRPFPDRDELIKLCIEHGRVFEPNEHFKYTNVGYSLLGLAIEAASGQSYADYVSEHIIGRLGLTNTGPEYDPRRQADYAAGHSGLLDGLDTRQAIGHVDTRGMAAATGFYSTAEDLTRYGAAHFFGAEELITDASKRLIQRTESVVTVNGKEQGRYGLGMDLTRIGDRQWVGHSGGYPGHITRTYIDPDGQVVVSVLTNCIGGPATQLAEGVIKLLDLAHRAPDGSAVGDGIDPHTFTGRFASLMGVSEIALLGGRLVALASAAVDPTDTWDELEVVDADTLTVTAGPGFGGTGEPMSYQRAADGTVELVRAGGGSRWPVEVFRQRRSGQIAALGQIEGGA
ncbi:serine hydrolase domain-containing protein [Microlunatus soli]|uniref:CubicO group peptidase, beta-lactamase class C family n=1 Tax=Microlunatus soli TaxID=630515 RepID=A0A1H1NY63_9ACTN|nr:serine hydrolase domain-containing protein [Microlunatus soli]SDS03725.1 CubicO group peptidase, beta-lactamase class C family [Microlunatus soli]